MPEATHGRHWWVDVEIDGSARRLLIEGPSARVAAASIEWAWREGRVREYPSCDGPVLVKWRQVAALRVGAASPSDAAVVERE